MTIANFSVTGYINTRATPPLTFASFKAIRYQVYGWVYPYMTITLVNNTDQPIVKRLIKYHFKGYNHLTGVWSEATSDFTQTLAIYGVPVIPAPGLISLPPGQSVTAEYLPPLAVNSNPADTSLLWLEDSETGALSAQITL